MAFGTFLMARTASASPAGADFLCELPHRSFSSGCPDETIFRRRRKRPETKAAYLPQPPNHGIVILTRLLNAIYREILSAAVPGIIRERARR